MISATRKTLHSMRFQRRPNAPGRRSLPPIVLCCALGLYLAAPSGAESYELHSWSSISMELPFDARATSSAIAHFDRDGIPDLAIGYRLPDGTGALAWLRGRGGAIYPRHTAFSAEAQNVEPFEMLKTQHVPIAVDWIVAGDFDASGRSDLVAASRDRRSIMWWPSIGDFALGGRVEVPLGGYPTALAAGEINRRDGLTDLVVGIQRETAAELLVFQSARGALVGDAERVALDAPVHRLTVGQYNDDPHGDIAVTIDTNTLLVSGRDRRLGTNLGVSVVSDATPRAVAAVSPADRLPDAVSARFPKSDLGSPTIRTAVAARLNTDAVADWIVLVDGSNEPIFVVSAPVTTYTVTSADDTDDGLCDAHCTLREAIQAANASAGADAIHFAIGSGPVTIQATSSWPAITEAVTLDATTQPGYLDAPIIELTGGAGIAGLDVDAGPTCIRGFILNAFEPSAIDADGSGSIIEGNYIGTDSTGLARRGNDPYGIYTDGAATDMLIGGTTAAARNIISGNVRHGVDLRAGAGERHTIQGNTIGLGADGATPIGNGVIGISTSMSFTMIGGADPGAGNVISGDADFAQDMGIRSVGSGSVILGNRIGTDASGTVALGNGLGITGSRLTIGGPAPGMGNTISGNIGDGIAAFGPAPCIIQGNRIGVAVDGVTPLGNLGNGIRLVASDCTVGGTEPGEGNIIAHSSEYAVETNNVFSNSILGNSIYDTGTAPQIRNQVFNPRPTLLHVSSSSTQTRIEGSFASGTENAIHRLEFFSNPACDSSGSGEGEVFLGATEITADANGAGSFSVVLPAGTTVGHAVTGTTTLPDGTTSRFSACETVVSAPDPFMPELSVPTDIDALPGATVRVPVLFTSNGAQIGALAFEIDVDQTCLGFDPTDADVSGLPDSVTLVGATGLDVSVSYDATDTAGELEILISQLPPLAAIPDGTLIEIEFSTCSPAPGTTEIATVEFTSTPIASFGDLNGQSVPGATSNGWVEVLSGLPGDCNGDGLVDAGDLTACALEIFDGDGNVWTDVPGGTFLGNPVGCDANGDAVVDAGDIVCTGLLIFGNGPCGGGSRAATLPSRPTLRLDGPFAVDAAGRARVSIELTGDGSSLAATAFSLDFGPGLSWVDGSLRARVATDTQHVTSEPSDADGELDVLLAKVLGAGLPWLDGALVEFEIESTEPTGSWIRFADQPSMSFGTTDGGGIPGAGSTAPVAVLPGLLFGDGFETATLSRWSATGQP